MVKLPPLTARAIRAYVAALPPDLPVGRKHDGQRCMVARYLEAMIAPAGERYMIVVSDLHIDITRCDERWHIVEKIHRIPGPELRRIIKAFDALPQVWPLPADVLPIFDKEQRT